MFLQRILGRGAVIAVCLSGAVRADEGMWLFNAPPVQQLKQKYNFSPDAKWLERVQKSAVRFNAGGSGSFVSEDGLVMSNHHVGAGAIQELSDEKNNYYRDGFYARTLDEEKKCHGMELNVLMSIEDVTERVNAVVTAEMKAEDAFAARRKIMAEIEKTSLEKTQLRSDVVTLYGGARYHLYRYKRYTDVRLVFAPESDIAFFGGDPDNFEFPRFDLDVCFFRVYEDGKPVRVEHYLKWSKGGPVENELVLVAGHPGRTSRLVSVAELEAARDRQLPFRLRRLNRLEVLLTGFSGRSAENARRAKGDSFGVQNSRKALSGRLKGLQDPALLAKKRDEESRLRDFEAQGKRAGEYVSPWERISEAQKIVDANALRSHLFEDAGGMSSQLFGIARLLLRAGDEREKPNGERLREFGDSSRESIELGLFSEEPIYDDLELLKLADALAWMAELLGFEDELVKKILSGKSPDERAAELIAGTKMKDVALRKELYDGGKKSVSASKDPMIALARVVDEESRRLRKISETQSEVKQQAHAQISKARFAMLGTNQYPDATFTLRLAYGRASGYEHLGKTVPFQTTFAGLFERAQEHNSQPPFAIPQSWLKKKNDLDLNTPFNFVSTADIIGGNSGSPVVNQNAEVVGLIFDGNIPSLVWDYVFEDRVGRAVSVHSKAITEAIDKVYGAAPLGKELATGRRIEKLP